MQLAALLSLAACSSATTSATAAEMAPVLFTVQAEGQSAVVRAITHAPVCPGIQWDQKTAVPMTVRAMPAVVAVRAGGAQTDNKEAIFDVLTCEAAWPAGALRARVAGDWLLTDTTSRDSPRFAARFMAVKANAPSLINSLLCAERNA